MPDRFEDAFNAMPLVAILRGLQPEEAADVGEVLTEAGFTLLEVPLNSPEPLRSIEILARTLGAGIVVGAGTVLEVPRIAEIAASGGTLVVMPHADTEVIGAAVRAGLVCVPGCATPTEGFAALAAGAHALKLFPAEVMGPPTLKAWRAVFPKTVRFLPVGGINPDGLAPWCDAGAAGFGIGGALFKPGMSTDDLAGRARSFVAAWRRQTVIGG